MARLRRDVEILIARRVDVDRLEPDQEQAEEAVRGSAANPLRSMVLHELDLTRHEDVEESPVGNRGGVTAASAN